MSLDRLRRLSAISLLVGGCSFLAWSVNGVVVAKNPRLLADAVLFTSYTATTLGVGSLSWVAQQTDDPTSTGVTPLAIGLVLLVPLLVGVTLGGSVAPHTELFLLVTASGVVAAVFGIAVLAATLHFTAASALVPQPWGRTAALLATGGILGWVVSVALGQPDPPQAFRIVNPYTTPLDASTLLIVVASSSALGLALCLLGGGILRQTLGASAGHPAR